MFQNRNVFPYIHSYNYVFREERKKNKPYRKRKKNLLYIEELRNHIN